MPLGRGVRHIWGIFLKRELRFRVGSQVSAHSTTWKIFTRKSDIYLLSRAFGSTLKVSLHETGECQFSRTAEWAAESGRPNQERHIVKWEMPDRRSPSTAILAFRIIFPQSELRVASADETEIENACVYPAPPFGQGAYVEVQVSPPMDEEPTESKLSFDPLGRDVLGMLPLSNGCYVIVLAHHLAMDPKNLIELDLLKSQLRKELSPDPRNRGWAFAEGPVGVPSLVEFAPSLDER